MDSVIGAVTLIGAGVYGLLALFVQFRAKAALADRRWLMAMLLVSALALAASLLPVDAQVAGRSARGLAALLLFPAAFAAFGALVVRDAMPRTVRLWLAFSGAWLALLLIAALTSQSVVGSPDWMVGVLAAPSLDSFALLGGFALAEGVLLILCFSAFYSATMPEAANRALYWALASGFAAIGTLLLVSGADAFVLLGALLHGTAAAGAVYATLRHRVPDIRGELGAVVRTGALVLLAGAVFFVTMTIARGVDTGNDRATLAYTVLALAAGLVVVPLGWVLDSVLRRLVSNPDAEAAEAARLYSQSIAVAGNTSALAKAVAESLDTALRARHGGLALVDTLSDAPAAELVYMDGEGREQRGFIALDSPFYRALADKRRPITHFDVERAPAYRSLNDDERRLLRGLRASAYAPVFVDNALSGILLGGPKTNDTAYSARDLAALAAMADQTAVALRNARLSADVRGHEGAVGSLKAQIEDAKRQVARLEQVKSDFITVASHELRTPLAQIRGYIDILDALNQSEALDVDQTAGMVDNLRRATERMEELIGAMLDASAIDTGAMELRFNRVSLESILRMAIEPLTEPIRQRRLTLAARGLRGLPMVEADTTRLVQAFRNVILNAIKFTPDGGRIDVTAAVQVAARPGERDQALITMADSGVGIDRDNLELIFYKFYRAYDPGLHSTGATKFMGAGPGLGLTIARGIIERHGGKIWATSEGHDTESFPGATLYVLLPVAPPEPPAQTRPLTAQASSEGAAARSGS